MPERRTATDEHLGSRVETRTVTLQNPEHALTTVPLAPTDVLAWRVATMRGHG